MNGSIDRCCTPCAALAIGWRRMRRPPWSTSVRITLGYAALFAFSSLLLIGFLWWRTAMLLDRRNDADIVAEARLIADQMRDFSVRGAVAAVQDRIAAPADHREILLLADPALKPLAGNLKAWPPQVVDKTGWLWTSLARNGATDQVRLLRVKLPDGLNLLVGRDVEGRVEIRALIVEALCWAIASTLVLAVGGGFLLRRAVLRRVEMINGAATAIIHGDLTRRVETHGTSDAFDQLAQTINLMLSQIQQLIESVRNASNAVAHDLRTPLAELRARLEELTLLRPSAAVTFDEVQKAVADIDGVIAVFNALLRLAEIDSGLRRSGFRRVQLAALATEIAELYAPLTEDKQVNFVVDTPSGLAVSGDPYLLAQAVGNLVDNAVKYAPERGTVSLRIVPDGDGWITIAVADNGPGIPEAERSRVTQRFYRCASDGMQSGIGLGLSVVAAVTRLHEGQLVLGDNHPGLRADLRLPTAPM
jgi:signal transduction histidine kinase